VSNAAGVSFFGTQHVASRRTIATNHAELRSTQPPASKRTVHRAIGKRSLYGFTIVPRRFTQARNDRPCFDCVTDMRLASFGCVLRKVHELRMVWKSSTPLFHVVFGVIQVGIAIDRHRRASAILPLLGDRKFLPNFILAWLILFGRDAARCYICRAHPSEIVNCA